MHIHNETQVLIIKFSTSLISFQASLNVTSSIHQQNAHTQWNSSINYQIFSYMFRRLLCHLQGESFLCSKLLLYFVIT